MEYQKIIHLLDKLDNTSNQPSKFRTKNWVEIDDDIDGVRTMLMVKSDSKLQC